MQAQLNAALAADIKAVLATFVGKGNDEVVRRELLYQLERVITSYTQRHGRANIRVFSLLCSAADNNEIELKLKWTDLKHNEHIWQPDSESDT